MTKTPRACLVALLAGALVASRFEGLVRVGVAAGAVSGVAAAAFGALWLGHWAKVDGRRAMRALVEGYLVLLGVLVTAALTLRFVPAVAERADLPAFLVAFAGAAFLPLLGGALDASAALGSHRLHVQASSGRVSS